MCFFLYNKYHNHGKIKKPGELTPGFLIKVYLKTIS
tara:strand:- start:3701 stop:3808 length:108 start_codon:yes stop_codon:yes gene_type:complete